MPTKGSYCLKIHDSLLDPFDEDFIRLNAKVVFGSWIHRGIFGEKRKASEKMRANETTKSLTFPVPFTNEYQSPRSRNNPRNQKKKNYLLNAELKDSSLLTAKTV